MRARAAILCASALFLALMGALVGLRARALWHEPSPGFAFVDPQSAVPGIPVLGRLAGAVTTVIPGSAADHAGLRPGDRIVTADGVDVTDAKALAERGRQRAIGDRVTYSVGRGAGAVREVELTLASPLRTFPALFSTLTSLVVALFFLAVGGLVFIRRPDESPARVFHLISVLAAAGYLTYPVVLVTPTDPLGATRYDLSASYLGLWIVGTVTAFVLASAFLHFGLVFPRRHALVERSPWLVRWIYLVPHAGIGAFVAGLLALVVTMVAMTRRPAVSIALTGAIVLVTGALTVSAVRRTRRAGAGAALGARPVRTLLVAVFGVMSVCAVAGLALGLRLVPEALKGIGALFGGIGLVLALMGILLSFPLLSLVALVSTYRRATPREKHQVRWPLWGMIVALSGNLLSGAAIFAASLFGDGPTPGAMLVIDAAGKLFYTLIPASFAVAILRYRLWNVDFIIRKTIVYGAITGVLALFFVVLAGAGGGLLVQSAGIEGVWLPVAATIVAGLVLFPLHARVQRVVDRVFYRRRTDLAAAAAALRAALAQARRPEDALPAAVEQVCAALQSRSGAVFLRTGDERPGEAPVARAAAAAGAAAETERPARFPFAAIAGLADGPNLLDGQDVPLDADTLRALRKLGLDALVPLRVDGRLEGALAVGRRASGTPLDEDALLFAAQAAAAIGDVLDASARRQDRQDLETARQIQRRLLPQKLPALPGCGIAVDWQPSRVVGGDYFDVVDYGGGLFGLVVADVSGKGLPAAMLMSNVQAAFRAIADASLSPAALCARLNRVLAGHVGDNRFITLFYGVLDTGARRLVYSNAGHCAGLVVGDAGADGGGQGERASARIRRLDEGGPVLGILPDVPFAQAEVELRAGDRVLLYTDGVVEAQDAAGDEFTEARLLALAAAHGPGRPDALVRTVVDAVREHGDGPPQDDLTLMVIAIGT